MNIKMAALAACVALLLGAGPAPAQQVEAAAPPAKAAQPAKAKAPAGAEIVIANPAPGGGTPSGKQIYAKDRAKAVASCKALCPNGGTLTPSIPPSDYWYCTCNKAIAD